MSDYRSNLYGLLNGPGNGRHSDWREVTGGAVEASGEDPDGTRYVVRVDRKTRERLQFMLSSRMCFDGTNWHPVSADKHFDSLHAAKVAGAWALLTYARCIVWEPTYQQSNRTN